MSTMTLQAQVLEIAEQAGYRSMWDAAPPRLRREQGIARVRLGTTDAVRCAATPAFRGLNHALGWDGRVDPWTIAGWNASGGCATYVAVSEHDPVAGDLARLGWVPGGAWAKFVRPADDPIARVDCPLDVRAVAVHEAAAYGALIGSVFDLPPALAPWFAALVGRDGWHVLGAYAGEELVATGSLFVTGDQGWATWGATAPAWRGQGAQPALFAARLALAQRLGLREVTTETGVGDRPGPSWRNMVDAGFRVAYRRPFWSPGATPSA